MNAILVQGAMQNEIDILMQKYSPGEMRGICGYKFYETSEPETGVKIIISLTEMGIMNACIATQLGISRYMPKYVINQGTAGGHVRDIHTGDIIIGETAVYINSTRSPQRAAGEGSCALEWRPSRNSLIPYGASEELVRAALDVPFSDARVICGRLGSGDIYSRESDRIDLLHSQLGELCEDMESAAVYKTCSAFGVPVIGIRIISNNELTREEECFERAWNTLQNYIYLYIKSLCLRMI